MFSGSERGSRIDLDQELVLMLFRDLLPRRLDQDMINRKRFEVLFPVVDPVLSVCLGLCDLRGTDIHELADLLEPLTDSLQLFFRILVLV